jgi:TetR/AcrR family transcriptional regulator, transcriptional repressor for nem operon
MSEQAPRDSRTRLLDAAQDVFRAKGHAAATVDDICQSAGVTKGSFFHHFKSKEELTLSAVAHWNTWTEALFATAPYHQAADPRDRVLGYVDFRAAIIDREVPEFTCLLGTLVQETYATHPAIRAVCDRGMSAHVANLTRDIEAVKERYVPDAAWSAASVGYFIQSVLQGSFILAKAKEDSGVVLENLRHLRCYLETLFTPAKREESQ